MKLATKFGLLLLTIVAAASSVCALTKSGKMDADRAVLEIGSGNYHISASR